MYTLNCLNNSLEASVYHGFTFPLYREKLKVLKSKSSIIAIAASDFDKPVGLVLAEIEPDGFSATVLSIFVAPHYRNQGIGTLLITRLEEELILRGCTSASLVFVTNPSITSAIECLLNKRNWTQPQPRMLVCKCNREILNASWLKREYQLPASFTIFPWTDITKEERLAIEQQQEIKPWIPPDLLPSENEDNFEPLNSLGVRYQGQVVGWVINHRVAPDTIRYTCSFIRPDLQKMGRLVPLYAEAIKRQAARPEIPNFICTVPLHHTPMARFAKRHLAPYIVSMQESRGTFKVFSKN